MTPNSTAGGLSLLLSMGCVLFRLYHPWWSMPENVFLYGLHGLSLSGSPSSEKPRYYSLCCCWLGPGVPDQTGQVSSRPSLNLCLPLSWFLKLDLWDLENEEWKKVFKATVGEWNALKKGLGSLDLFLGVEGREYRKIKAKIHCGKPLNFKKKERH